MVRGVATGAQCASVVRWNLATSVLFGAVLWIARSRGGGSVQRTQPRRLWPQGLSFTGIGRRALAGASGTKAQANDATEHQQTDQQPQRPLRQGRNFCRGTRGDCRSPQQGKPVSLISGWFTAITKIPSEPRQGATAKGANERRIPAAATLVQEGARRPTNEPGSIQREKCRRPRAGYSVDGSVVSGRSREIGDDIPECGVEKRRLSPMSTKNHRVSAGTCKRCNSSLVCCAETC